MRRIFITLSILVACLGVPRASAQSEAGQAFEAADRIGSVWAYSEFLRRYPTGGYADRARERITRLGDLQPGADFFWTRAAIPPASAADRPNARRHVPVTSPNYGDNYFMRRHLPLRHWQR